MTKNTRLSTPAQLQFRIPERGSLGTRLCLHHYHSGPLLGIEDWVHGFWDYIYCCKFWINVMTSEETWSDCLIKLYMFTLSLYHIYISSLVISSLILWVWLPFCFVSWFTTINMEIFRATLNTGWGLGTPFVPGFSGLPNYVYCSTCWGYDEQPV